MTHANALELLRRANGKLRSAIESLNPQRQTCLNVEADDLAGLLDHLVRAGECLREMPNDVAGLRSDLACERATYHSLLQELERRLPDFYSRLLAERTRLVEAQRHLDLAAEWAGSHHSTF